MEQLHKLIFFSSLLSHGKILHVIVLIVFYAHATSRSQIFPLYLNMHISSQLMLYFAPCTRYVVPFITQQALARTRTIFSLYTIESLISAPQSNVYNDLIWYSFLAEIDLSKKQEFQFAYMCTKSVCSYLFDKDNCLVRLVLLISIVVCPVEIFSWLLFIVAQRQQ